MLDVERFETSDGVPVACWVSGHGTPVLVCHGGPTSTHAYLVDDLSELSDRATLVFHDYRGSGASGVASPTTYAFERLADDVDELREYLGFEEVTLLAHSMGGFVALQYALRHPDRCRQLILMSCMPAGTMKRLALPTLRAMGAAKFVRMVGQACGYVGRWSWRRQSEAKTQPLFALMRVPQEGRSEWRDEVTAREVRLFARNDNVPALRGVMAKTDLCEALSAITCPVLVVYGDGDAPIVSAAGLLGGGLQNARTVCFTGVGHHPLVEEHEQTIRAIAQALETP